MINTKEELNEYLEKEREVYRKVKNPRFVKRLREILAHDGNYEYMNALRKYEYYYNTGGGDTAS